MAIIQKPLGNTDGDLIIYFICDPCNMSFWNYGAPNRNDNIPEIIAKSWHGN